MPFGMTQLLHDAHNVSWTEVGFGRDNGPLCARIREEIANAESLEYEIGTVITLEDDIERGVVYVATETGDAYVASMSSRSPDGGLVIEDIDDALTGR